MSDPPYLYWIICLHSQIYKTRDTSNAVSNQQLSKPFSNLKPLWKLSLSINPSGRFSVDSRRWNYRNVSTVFRTLNAGPLGELFKIDRIIKTKSESVKYFFGLFLWESFYSFEYGLPCFIWLTSLLPLTVTDRHSSWLPGYRYLGDIPRWRINTLCPGKDCVFLLQDFFFFFLSANVFHTDTMRWQFKIEFFLNKFWGTPCTRSLGYPLMRARVRRRRKFIRKKTTGKKEEELTHCISNCFLASSIWQSIRID